MQSIAAQEITLGKPILCVMEGRDIPGVPEEYEREKTFVFNFRSLRMTCDCSLENCR